MRLIARDISYSYPNRQILCDLDFTLQQGDCIAIVGPSGSGKTTLLAVLGGLIQPDEGTVMIDASDPSTKVADNVSWILQTMNALPDRSVLDNVAIGALAGGLTHCGARELALNALAGVGLADRADEPIRLLSGGEAQRVGIARALVSGRPFTLADEPTGQLDRFNTETVIDALVASTEHNEEKLRRGLVVVTHDRAVAERCAELYELVDGRLQPQ